MYRLGIYLEANDISAGIVDEKYNIIELCKIKLDFIKTYNDIMAKINSIILTVLSNANLQLSSIDAIGIGMPGIIDSELGIVQVSNEFQMNNFPIVSILKEELGKNVYIDNNCNSAAYGEYIVGTGKIVKNFLHINFGTNLSGGIILNKKIYGGLNFYGEQFGHIKIIENGMRCNCGICGCYNLYASSSALIDKIRDKIISNTSSKMWEITKHKDMHSAAIQTAVEAMNNGDEVAKEIIEDYLEYVAIGLKKYLDIYHPEIIFVGGSIFDCDERFISILSSYLDLDNDLNNNFGFPRIQLSKCGKTAGIIGAAYLTDLYK